MSFTIGSGRGAVGHNVRNSKGLRSVIAEGCYVVHSDPIILFTSGLGAGEDGLYMSRGCALISLFYVLKVLAMHSRFTGC